MTRSRRSWHRSPPLRPAPSPKPARRAAAGPSVHVQIRGHDLPGHHVRPGPRRAHVRERPCRPRPSRARRSSFVPETRTPSTGTFEVTVKRTDDGELDFGGPFVYGARGERALGLRWGTLAGRRRVRRVQGSEAEAVRSRPGTGRGRLCAKAVARVRARADRRAAATRSAPASGRRTSSGQPNRARLRRSTKRRRR